MTHAPLEQIFRARLRQAIDELRRDGWDVTEEPGPDSLPEALRNWEPDLVAIKGSQILVGEVKSRHSTNLRELNSLSAAVARLANARFEVYWLGDAPETEPPIDNVRTFIREASELSQSGHIIAGTLTAWAALEGAIIQFASDKDNLQTWRSPWQLLSNLYSLGYISEKDFGRLSSFGKLRNEIAHHASRVPPSAQDVEFVLAIAERMISGRYVSVDQMIEWFLENYEIPAISTPHETAEGGYQYAGNGPYDPHEVLSEEFPNATEDDIVQAVDSLEETAPEWVAKHPHDESSEK